MRSATHSKSGIKDVAGHRNVSGSLTEYHSQVPLLRHAVTASNLPSFGLPAGLVRAVSSCLQPSPIVVESMESNTIALPSIRDIRSIPLGRNCYHDSLWYQEHSQPSNSAQGFPYPQFQLHHSLGSLQAPVRPRPGYGLGAPSRLLCPCPQPTSTTVRRAQILQMDTVPSLLGRLRVHTGRVSRNSPGGQKKAPKA